MYKVSVTPLFGTLFRFSGQLSKEEATTDLRLVVQVLEVLIFEEPEWGIRQLGRRLALSTSATHRLVQAMEGAKLVQQDAATRRYRMGTSFYHLAAAGLVNFTLLEAARPIMQSLVAVSREASYLCLRDGIEGLFVYKVESEHPIQYTLPIGLRASLHMGAGLKVMLAHLPAAERQRVYAVGLEAATNRTVTDPAKLEENCEQIRRSGWAFSQSERVEGAVAVAAPVFDARGDVVASILLSMPETRFTMERLPVLSRLVRQAGDELSQQIGYQPKGAV